MDNLSLSYIKDKSSGVLLSQHLGSGGQVLKLNEYKKAAESVSCSFNHWLCRFFCIHFFYFFLPGFIWYLVMMAASRFV